MEKQTTSPRSKSVRESQGARPLGLDDVPEQLEAPLRWYEGARRKFVFAALFSAVGWLGSMVLGDLYDQHLSWYDSDDAFVQKIADKQKEEFDSLRASLGDIRSSLPAEGRDAFRTLERSLANVERDSAGLVQQLDLAKKEIETLRAVSVNRGGVAGGYDFTLSENSGMDLAPGALLGVTRVASGSVQVNLTSGGATTVDGEFLKAGESREYVGANGGRCWVVLRSLQDGRPGAASFNTGCAA